MLVTAGASVNETAPDGTSALVVAAHSGHSETARFLLEKGANPSAAGAGYTALHAAILRGDAELVKALLAHRVNPNAPILKPTPVRRNSADYALEFNVVGATPFWLAARFLEPAIMRALLSSGADPLFAMKNGTTALMAATQGRRRTEPGFTADPVRDEALALEAAQIAVAAGVNVNAATTEGDTALHTAAQRRLNRVVQFLAERGAALDARNKAGQTPLAVASGGDNGPGRASSTADLLRKLGARD
jgi:ankyrin repeat protein